MTRSPQYWVYSLLLLSLSAISFTTAPVYAAKGQSNRPAGDTTTQDQPLAIMTENYNFRYSNGSNNCLGEDDHLRWQAKGSLAPGESFSFTPLYPGCAGHPAVVSVTASWTGGQLTVTSTAPAADYASSDPEQLGQQITAPISNEQAQLCMFPRYLDSHSYYTVTISNDSDQTVHEITITGQSENAWPLYYYSRCLNADADADGWNDALEQTMAIMVYPNGYIEGIFQPDLLWGSNYLRATAITPFSNDEVDAYPADLDDNGIVDLTDLSIIENYLGQGNGIPLQAISPNPSSGFYYFHSNTRPWRRYDLDGDGLVNDTDRRIIDTLLNTSLPPAADWIAPSAKLLAPVMDETLPRGQYVKLEGHVWDNAGLASVTYQVNGKTICSVNEPVPNTGFTSPFYYCWWETPKKRGQYELTVLSEDTSGQITVSLPVSVQVQ